MRISLKFIFPFSIVLLLFFTTLLLLFGSTYFFYQIQVKQLVEEKTGLLQFLKKTIYQPYSYYRAVAFSPEAKFIALEEAAKIPGVVFLRLIEIGTGKVIWTSLEKEKVGDIITNPPRFSSEINLREGNWEGKLVKEIFIRGSDSEGLWLATDLEMIQKTAFNLAMRQGVIVLIILISLYSILFFISRQLILIPLGQIYRTILQVRQGNLDVRANVKSKTEIGELANIFNEMIKDLKESRAALEESKKVLEIKVAARTRELKELTEKQEEIIKERTKELQKRVAELEKFQKLVVGRELKMIELKKALKQAQEEIKKLKEVEKND